MVCVPYQKGLCLAGGPTHFPRDSGNWVPPQETTLGRRERKEAGLGPEVWVKSIDLYGNNILQAISAWRSCRPVETFL